MVTTVYYKATVGKMTEEHPESLGIPGKQNNVINHDKDVKKNNQLSITVV